MRRRRPAMQQLAALVLSAIVSVDFVVAADEKTYEAQDGLFLTLSGPGQDCDFACSAFGSVCSVDSLLAGAPYGTQKSINGTVANLGRSCLLVADDERIGRAFPVVDERDFCFGSPSENRNNYDCSATSGMAAGGRRLCSCFSEARVEEEAATPRPTSGNVAVADSAAGSSAPGPTTPDSPYVPDGYTLSWRDDFNGKELDKDNWSYGLVYDVDPSVHVIWHTQHGGPGLLNNNYDGYIVDRNVVLRGNGELWLANRKEETPFVGTEPAGDFQYTSGWINSLRKRYFNGAEKGVYLEVRASFPKGRKVWPAIWLIAEENVWPPEVDIWEYFGQFYNVARRTDEMHLRNIWGYFRDKQTHVIELQDWHESYSGYRTLGWLWTSEKLVWYIDGVAVATKKKGPDIQAWGWPDQDMSLILNNGLMSAVDDTGTNFPNFLKIDYLAVYEYTEGTAEPTSTPTAAPSTSTESPTVSATTEMPSTIGVTTDSPSISATYVPTGTPQVGEPTDTPQGGEPTDTPQGGEPTGTPQGDEPTDAPQGDEPTISPTIETESSAVQVSCLTTFLITLVAFIAAYVLES